MTEHHYFQPLITRIPLMVTFRFKRQSMKIAYKAEMSLLIINKHYTANLPWHEVIYQIQETVFYPDIKHSEES